MDSNGYAAFISYSRRDAAELAGDLQSAVERFAKPWNRLRAVRTFRDDASLSGSPALWSTIETALQQSTWFILIATPEAAASEWVDRELRWWRANRDVSRIIVVLARGTLLWPHQHRDYDTTSSTALPPALLNTFGEEPRYLDLRWYYEAESLQSSNPLFQQRVADISSSLQGRPRDELIGENVRQHRRFRVFRRSSVAALSILLIASVIAAVVAVRQGNEATRQADNAKVQQSIAESQAVEAKRQKDLAVAAAAEATQQQQVATVRQLLAQANVLADSDPRTALKLALAARTLQPATKTPSLLADADASLVAHIMGSHLQATLTGHTLAVRSIAFSPDGKTLATGSDDHTVMLWNIADANHPIEVGTPMKDHTGPVYSVAFSPDGKILATGGGGKDHTVDLWNVSDPAHPVRLQQLLGHEGAIWSIAFSPNGKTVLTGSQDNTAILWDIANPSRPTRLGQMRVHSEPIRTVAFSPGGDVVATGSQDNEAVLWDVSDRRSPQQLGSPLSGHDNDIQSLAFSRDGKTLAVAGVGVALWNVTDPGRPSQFSYTVAGHAADVRSVVLSTDGKTMATAGADHAVILWNITDPHRPTPIGAPLIAHTATVQALAFSRDGTTLASGGLDQTTVLWHVEDATEPAPIQVGATDMPTATALSPDSQLLATAAPVGTEKGPPDGTVTLWDVSNPTGPTLTGKPFSVGQVVKALAFSPNSHLLAVGSGKNVLLWNVADPHKPIRISPSLAGHSGTVTSLAFSRDGRTLASGSSDRTVRLWDLTDASHPTPGQSLGPYQHGVSSVVFSPIDNTLASAGADYVITLWNVASAKQATKIGDPLAGHAGAINSLAYSADGQVLASAGSDDHVVLWNMSNPTKAAAIGVPLTSGITPVTGVALSPDHHTMAASSSDNTIVLWDVTDSNEPTRIGTLSTGDTTASTLAFSSDLRTLATDSGALWSIYGLEELRRDDELKGRACAITAGGLSSAEWSRFVSLPFVKSC